MTAEQTPNRPRPEELLQRYGYATESDESSRGKLHVFLGAAPGVGKTYAMLNEGQRLAAEGHDVVAGFIETHDRPETAARIGNLEVVPRQRVTHRGVSIEELDTAAILARKPEIVLIDELAHTNAPGSERVKRFEDIELLLDAGIDVLTTVNVQHLESLNAVVAGITGITVKETIPDRVVNDADRVQLIDLPSEALRERLAQGKVYPASRANQALVSFFREGNLTALRELALRQTAAGVNEQLESYMREHQIDDVWPAAERVAVIVPPGPDAANLLRRGFRLASAMHGELVAFVLIEPGTRQELIQNAKHLAEDLGARILEIEGRSRAEAIANAVRSENAGFVVLGHSPASRWNRVRGQSLIEDLLSRLDNVQLMLVELGSEDRS